MQLAEYDVARCLEPLDSPVMKEFVENIDPVFALAESSAGFIWRCNADENDADSFLIDDDPFSCDVLSFGS